MAASLEFGKDGGEATVTVSVFLLGWVPSAGCKDFIEVRVAIVSGIDHTIYGKSFEDISSFGSIFDNLRHNTEEVNDGILL